jgi:MFS family permease
MDLYQLILLALLEGIVGGIAVILSLTYVSFVRMEKNVRRARMFIMADRIQRFLGAFTLGFVVLALTFALSSFGSILPSAVFAVAFFFFLAMIAYGILELYFIVRPRRKVHSPDGTSWRPSFGSRAAASKPDIASLEDDPHASR